LPHSSHSPAPPTPHIHTLSLHDALPISEFLNNSVGVLLNVSTTGNPQFGITNSLTANCHGTFAVAAADFNMDGKVDIAAVNYGRSEEHTSELQSQSNLVCRLLLEKKKTK